MTRHRVKVLLITLVIITATFSAWTLTTEIMEVSPVPLISVTESLAPKTEPLPATIQQVEGNPVAVIVESVGIESALMPLGLNPDGTLEVPPDSSISGWYTGGPKPGELGPAVIASHVSWYGVKGPFFALVDVMVGDVIIVVNSDDTKFKFEVISTATYAKELFPTELVYGNLDYAGLRLITCDLWDTSTKRYANNLLVYAKLVP